MRNNILTHCCSSVSLCAFVMLNTFCIGHEGENSGNIFNSIRTHVENKKNIFRTCPTATLEDFKQESATDCATAWSIDGKYVATVGQANSQAFLVVYPVVGNTFGQPISYQGTIGNILRTVAWAPAISAKGYYFAVGGQDTSGNQLVEVFVMNNDVITLVASASNSATLSCTEQDETNLVFGVSWFASDMGNFLAVAESDNQKMRGYLRIYQFMPSSSDLEMLAEGQFGNCCNAVASNQTIDPSAWLIPVAGFTGSSADQSENELMGVFRFEFDSATGGGSLLQMGSNSASSSRSEGLSVSWLSGTTYIAYCGKNYTNTADLRIYSYNPESSPTLQIVASNTDANLQSYSVSWARQLGQYLAVGGTSGETSGIQGLTTIYQFTPDSKLSEILNFVDFVASGTPMSIPCVSWQPGQYSLAQVGQDSDGKSHTSLYSINFCSTFKLID